eukprot:GHVT01076337.1.p1 GENE.GHVT01076337.1~~GHVT01076337.1.p1  ORF type:complete len:331 (+),score=45.01 GHVT01076337.1:871-1863(+)
MASPAPPSSASMQVPEGWDLPTLCRAFDISTNADGVAQIPGPYCGSWPVVPSTKCQSVLQSVDPSRGTLLGETTITNDDGLNCAIARMSSKAAKLAAMPTPLRGEIVRQFGEQLRLKKVTLARLLCREVGKIETEAQGEIQEVIDICTMAAGMARQIAGKVLPSERPAHVMYELWQPLGLIAVVTAFNFPVAVLGWNAAIALICGNCILWKPAPTTSLVSAAIAHILHTVLEPHDLAGAFCVCYGEIELGRKIVSDPRMALVSFTGSVRAGREVAVEVQKRMGRCLLELGGNNAMIVMDDADLKLAADAAFFAAVRTLKEIAADWPRRRD